MCEVPQPSLDYRHVFVYIPMFDRQVFHTVLGLPSAGTTYQYCDKKGQ